MRHFHVIAMALLFATACSFLFGESQEAPNSVADAGPSNDADSGEANVFDAGGGDAGLQGLPFTDDFEDGLDPRWIDNAALGNACEVNSGPGVTTNKVLRCNLFGGQGAEAAVHIRFPGAVALEVSMDVYFETATGVNNVDFLQTLHFDEADSVTRLTSVGYSPNGDNKFGVTHQVSTGEHVDGFITSKIPQVFAMETWHQLVFTSESTTEAMTSTIDTGASASILPTNGNRGPFNAIEIGILDTVSSDPTTLRLYIDNIVVDELGR